MALKKCKECGEKVSSKADLCPHCGAKQKRKSIGYGGALLIVIILGFIGSQFSEYQQKAQESKQADHQEEIRKQKNDKYKNEQKTFEKNMESHYTELVKFAEEKDFESFYIKINLFKKFGKSNYKDVKKYDKVISTQYLSEKVKKIPASKIHENLKTYKELLALNPNEQTYKSKVNHYQKKWDKHLKEKQKKEYKASCQLEIVNSSWSNNYGYSTYEGQVKNISNFKLKNVQAVVTWYDKNGDMITSDSSLIKYNPILPGQTSPFKVMETYNPAMQKAGVEFSHLMGGTIKTYSK